MRTRLVAIALSLVPAWASAETLEFVGAIDWKTESVVGISGLEVSRDGATFVGVTDHGWWVEGQFDRRDAAIVSVDIEQVRPIIEHDGWPVSSRRVGDWSDAEGLAIADDGTAYISYERWARVSRFDTVNTPASYIRAHETFYDHADNWELEAVAVSPEGVAYAFSEKPLPDGFPIYRLDTNDLWQIDGYLREEDIFAIVGADFADDGSLYLLERKLVVGFWWQSRIRRVRLDGREDVVLWTSNRGDFGNLEGISVWYDDDGLRLTLVSDNNGAEGTPTQFVEFRLTQ
jgi:hypothetical protein